MWPIKQWIMDVREYWVETDSWSSLNGLICFIFLCRRHSFTFLSFFLIGDYWNAASFTTPSSYLHFATFQGETSADISFYFKTSAPYGVFLENLGNTDFIRLELKCKTHLPHVESLSCQVYFTEWLYYCVLYRHTHTHTRNTILTNAHMYLSAEYVPKWDARKWW